MNNLFIFDIDGTIADSQHRLHHILHDDPKLKDWDAYDAEWEGDTLIPGIAHLVRYLNLHGANVMYLTGRSTRSRANTLKWLKKHDLSPRTPAHLVMRKNRDYRNAGIIKIEYLEKLGIGPDNVHTIFDDNNHVVRSLRDAGYHVCHVADDFTTAVHEGGPGQFDDEESIEDLVAGPAGQDF